MESIVALDLETTGLDPAKDRVIEIGAVKFTPRRIEGEYSTLINPGRPIPPFITQLTGITDQMVVNAPSIQQAIPELARFVGNCTILGQNIGFDLSFLKKHHIGSNNRILDTYEIASVVLPTSPRYNLNSLANMLSVLLPANHRALDDAQATRGVFSRLMEEINKIPLDILAEIVRQGDGLDWNGYWAFRQIFQERIKNASPTDHAQKRGSGPLFQAPLPESINLVPKETPDPIDPLEVSAVLEQGGVFAKNFPDYEFRPQQIEMLQSVYKALTAGNHLMVEAGTGIGKSMAYLIPSAFWATNNDYRVVISTNTINLQDQLINKDIPDLERLLKLGLRVAVIKGRANYLCLRRFENLRRRGVQNTEELRTLAKVMVWMQSTKTGDRAELNLNNPADRETWLMISAEDEGCNTETCLKRMGGICPYYRMRLAAQSAHILIVNHALLLADVATGNRVLPPYDYLIIDEAHHLEDATTNALSYHLNRNDVDRLMREFGGPNSGLLGRLQVTISKEVPPELIGKLDYLIQRATDFAFRFESLSRDFFKVIDTFFYDHREGQPIGTYSYQARILPAFRTQPAWTNVEVAWDEVEHTLVPLLDNIKQILQSISDNIEFFVNQDEDLYSDISNHFRRLSDLLDKMHALVFTPDAGSIYWVEIKNDQGFLSLNTAPLHIGSLMQKYIWNEKTSVILTSATLATAGDFSYLRGRLGGEEVNELAVGSPFDYETSTLILLADDIPEPVDRYAYQKAIENSLIQLCKTTGGRTLVLFTSYEQLRRTSQAISPILAKEDILVFEQGEGASPHTLLESFRTAEKAILLGTRAFWEGVDVPGEALSVLVIVRLPFDVPSDPIISARAETFEDSFYQYSLPEAILRFRQGFGRLIRSQQDRGVVLILDSRILKKKYGKLFLSSLPTCTVEVGPVSNVPRKTKQWLNL